jgi:hypothetical protein
MTLWVRKEMIPGDFLLQATMLKQAATPIVILPH